MLTKIVGGLVFLLNGRKNRRFLCKFGIKPKSLRLGMLQKYLNGINICPLSCIQEVLLRHIALLDAIACVSLV